MSLRWWNTLAKNVAEPIFFEVVENLDTRMCMNYGFYREYRYCQCRTVSLCIKEWSRLADREESGKCPHGVYSSIFKCLSFSFAWMKREMGRAPCSGFPCSVPCSVL